MLPHKIGLATRWSYTLWPLWQIPSRTLKYGRNAEIVTWHAWGPLPQAHLSRLILKDFALTLGSTSAEPMSCMTTNGYWVLWFYFVLRCCQNWWFHVCLVRPRAAGTCKSVGMEQVSSYMTRVVHSNRRRGSRREKVASISTWESALEANHSLRFTVGGYPLWDHFA